MTQTTELGKVDEAIRSGMLHLSRFYGETQLEHHRRQWLTVFLIVVTLSFSSVGNFVQAETKVSEPGEVVTLFHGIPLDRNGRVIEINETNLPDFYSALAQRVFDASGQESQFRQALSESQIQLNLSAQSKAVGQSNFGMMDFIIDTFLNEGKIGSEIAPDISLQLNVLRQTRQQGAAISLPSLGVRFDQYLSEYKLRNVEFTQDNYKACEDKDVPKPPNYGDKEWTNEYDLEPKNSLFVYLQNWKDEIQEYPAKISYYQPADGLGLCAMLKRYKIKLKSEAERHLQLVGVICESATTNKTCLWENRLYDSENGKELLEDELADKTNQNISGSWANSAQQKLSMPCQGCHIGDNSFIFYKDTKLCFDNSYEQPCYKGSDNKIKQGLSSIIGYAGQSKKIYEIENSGVSKGNKCAGCHSLASYSDNNGNLSSREICSLFSFVVEKHLMPPNNSNNSLEWSGVPGNHPYQASVNELWKFCNPDQ